jgi:AraC-like DNA-binding protein
MDPEFLLSVVDYHCVDSQRDVHWHDYLQVALCTEGHGKFIFTNKEYEVNPGDIFIVSNFEHHVALAEGEEDLRFLMVIFMPEFVAPPGSRKFDYEYLSPFWYDTRTFCNKIDANLQQARLIGSIIREMQQQKSDAIPGSRYLLDANLRRILATLISFFSSDENSNSNSATPNHLKIREALQYINENFLDNLTVDKIADRFHFSESWFRHCFKDTIRVGFKEYVTYLRLTEARRLLLTTDWNINDIAVRSGFSNINQFYKMFNKYVFMTPADFRKKYTLSI